MENKYFTPNIEDIIVGYECEIRAPKYEGQKFIIDEDQVQYAALCIRGGFLFTPYLTKEQIEAEGWIYKTTNFKDWVFTKSYYTLQYLYDKKAMYISELTEEGYTIIFRGSCKDINTFRYICKLLNIK